ncbi:MAG: glycosyltransferase [Catenisphaera adipataccumulans]|jgi:glycosyltransferase involved in cell wall biosynthesis|uniref:glycosyltransferase n=1 Tax=Catenisphaera adipataccumulans TaxID=700500 RepID=UPI003D931314
MKRRIVLVFDILPHPEAGGLSVTYQALIPLLQDRYDFCIISVFNCGYTQNERYPDTPIINLFRHHTDIRYAKIKPLLKQGHLLQVLNILYSIFLYLAAAPAAGRRMKKHLRSDDILIAVSPAAARFIPKARTFILEVHVFYEYFFGKNKLGRIQASLMKKPALTIFRTKADMKKAMPTMNAHYVYNFFDETKYDSLLQIDAPTRSHRILFMGRLNTQKNPERMLRCAEALKKRGVAFQLDIYGTGPKEEKMREWIRSHDLTSCVAMKGFTKDKTIYNQYALHWQTSDFEGLSLSIIEAKAFGVPTISTDWGPGVYEVIHDGQDGYICQSEDQFVQKTAELLNDRERMRAMSYAAKQNAAEFGKTQARRHWLYILENAEKGNYQLEENWNETTCNRI